ncbi:DUF6894 family protein [Rhizobium gallicum]|uniref:DUF6894 family protein n=1 Tax=Rhizobium gallicum TaxID=56730 RepID=UPI003AAE6C1B
MVQRPPALTQRDVSSTKGLSADLPTLEDARHEALNDARVLMSDAVLRGRDISDRNVEPCDDAGRSLQFSLQMRSSDTNSPMRHAHWNAYQPLVLRLGQAVAATGNFLELFPVDDAYVTPR